MATNNNDVLGFLNENVQVHLPTGGSEFTPTGFIGKTFAGTLYSFMSKTDSKDGTHDEVPQYEGRTQRGEWFVYYYPTQAAAVASAEMLGVEGYNGGKPNARRVWNIRIDRSTVLNFAKQESLDKFPPIISFDVEMKTLDARAKKRHEWNLFALPLAVQAMAKLLGYEYEPFSISDLLAAQSQARTRAEELAEELRPMHGADAEALATEKADSEIFTDAFQFGLIGSNEAGKGTPEHFENSKMWKQRAALWASLGEDNPFACYPIGFDEDKKFVTTSPKLSKCLTIAALEWKTPVYARVVNFPDPAVGASYKDKEGSTKRNQISALYDIYPSEAAAQEAAKADLARLESTSESNGSVAKIVIPEMWGDKPDEFLKKINQLREAGADATPKLAKSLGMSMDALTEALGTV